MMWLWTGLLAALLLMGWVLQRQEKRRRQRGYALVVDEWNAERWKPLTRQQMRARERAAVWARKRRKGDKPTGHTRAKRRLEATGEVWRRLHPGW